MTVVQIAPINPKHQRFADEYLVDFNGTEAYKRAGYKGTGNAAYVGASKLLARDDIQKYLATRRRELAEKVGVTQEQVRERLVNLAFADRRKLYDACGNLKPIHELSEAEAAMIEGLETFEAYVGSGENRTAVGRTMKVKTVKPIDALRLLGQDLGMFRTKVELTGPNGKPVQHEHGGLKDLLDEINGADTGPGPSVGRRRGTV